jgi:hypothetical protein
MKTIQEFASEASNYMTTDTRPDGSTFWKTTDNCPDWVSDLVRSAHGEMMPDDYLYRWTAYALEAFSSYDDPERAIDDISPDVYNWDLLNWVSSNLWRMGYVDEAMENGAKTLADALMMGQTDEMREVFYSVLESLVSLTETEEA